MSVGTMSEVKGVAVIVGGAGTIGVACAERLTEHRLLLADTSEDRLAEAAQRLEGQGATVSTQVVDITDAGSVSRLAAIAGDLGPLRALVNSAGFSGAQADNPTILRVNLLGTLLVLDAFEPLVTEGAVGVMIASVGGHRSFARHYDPILSTAEAGDVMARLDAAGALGLHPRAAYAISKRGVILQVEVRSGAWGARGGRLVSVSPGLIGDSTMGALVGAAAAYADVSALGRAGYTREIGSAVAFMCSTEASYVSGVDLLVDGGTRAGTDWRLEDEGRVRWHGTPSFS
jgi:NAD(P)-dependent dehydrogenase (short-subunit alcohol dehydrogenase family)